MILIITQLQVSHRKQTTGKTYFLTSKHTQKNKRKDFNFLSYLVHSHTVDKISNISVTNLSFTHCNTHTRIHKNN